MICRIKQNSFQFLLEKLGVRDQSNVNGQAVPSSWCSDGERPLWWDQSRTRNNQIDRAPQLSRERRVLMLVTGITNSVRYDDARPLTAWNTERQSLNLILSAIVNQWNSYIASVTWSRGPESWTNRTAALRTLWSGASVDAGKWVSTELQ